MNAGWGEIDNNKQVKTVKIKPTDQEFLLTELFVSKKGKLVLEYLAKLTIEKPSFQTMFTDGTNTAIGMAIREGENNLYRKIKSIIDKVEKYGTGK